MVAVQANVDVQAAGVVINTMGWIEGLGYELLLHSIDTLKADVVLVVGQERLYNQLRNHLRCGPVPSVKLSLMNSTVQFSGQSKPFARSKLEV
jgi:polyribonucleotide 5'-hydroxyl-kinase